MFGLEPAFVTCGFFLVTRCFPAWLSAFDASSFSGTGFTSCSIVSYTFTIVVDSARSLVAGFAYGSLHWIFILNLFSGPLIKVAVDATFLNIPINITMRLHGYIRYLQANS